VADAAKKVVETGDTVVFEVMSSADRKVVHDTVGDLDGVVSGSEGEDPRRRVVLKPA
jgi:spoIIIJ-associated protein